ncbi:hypothetical protein EVAR_53581_1 [Eumeta japonica]|uniref:Uncharacterized protein n=1 Tax=Eumeta variegata TaxID=151549 RepID=A0A4C1YKE7_EUMVA|nr:hypothetical protein EVAR_53581_1 [Eumeta japonica]
MGVSGSALSARCPDRGTRGGPDPHARGLCTLNIRNRVLTDKQRRNACTAPYMQFKIVLDHLQYADFIVTSSLAHSVDIGRVRIGNASSFASPSASFTSAGPREDNARRQGSFSVIIVRTRSGTHIKTPTTSSTARLF